MKLPGSEAPKVKSSPSRAAEGKLHLGAAAAAAADATHDLTSRRDMVSGKMNGNCGVKLLPMETRLRKFLKF